MPVVSESDNAEKNTFIIGEIIIAACVEVALMYAYEQGWVNSIPKPIIIVCFAVPITHFIYLAIQLVGVICRISWVNASKVIVAILSLIISCLLTGGLFLAEGPPEKQAFRIEMRAALLNEIQNELSPIMVGYPTIRGDTASPVSYLLFLQIANLQDVSDTIENYTVSIGKTANGPWEALLPIPLTHCDLYMLGIRSAPGGGEGAVALRRAYYLGRAMTKDDLRHAALLLPEPRLDSELVRSIAPHNTIAGWSAFDSIEHKKIASKNFLQIKVRDTAGLRFSCVTLLSMENDQYEANSQEALIKTAGTIADMSRFFIRYCNDPISLPTPTPTTASSLTPP